MAILRFSDFFPTNSNRDPKNNCLLFFKDFAYLDFLLFINKKMNVNLGLSKLLTFMQLAQILIFLTHISND